MINLIRSVFLGGIQMLKALIGTVVLGMTALPVAASVMQIEYSGTLSSGYDATGVFGTAGTNLTGLTYTMTFTYDTSVGVRTGTASYDYIYGGYHYGTPSPTASTLVVNGSAVDGNGDYYALDQRRNDGSTAYTFDVSNQYTVDPVTGAYVYNFGYFYADDLTLGLPVDLETPYSFDVADGSGSGWFDYWVHGPISTERAYGSMGVDRVTVSDVAPVPLPASAGLLFAALGALVGLRSRRRKLV